MPGQIMNPRSGITQSPVARPVPQTKAPAVFNAAASRPQATVQRASAPAAHQHLRAQAITVSQLRPPAPPVYRPQAAVQRAVPSVVRPPIAQTRAVSPSIPRMPGPAVYHPQAAVQRTISSVARPVAQQPRTSPVGTPRPFPVAALGTAPAFSPFAQQRPVLVPPQHGHGQRLAIQPFAPHLRQPQQAISQFRSPDFVAGGVGVVQPHGPVVQLWDFWGVAGYVTDAISFVGTVSGIISAFVLASNAASWGWLVPLMLPAISTLINTIIGIRAKRTGNEAQLGLKDSEGVDYLNALIPFFQAVVPLVLGVGEVQLDSPAFKWIAAAATSLMLIIAEFLRVKVTLNRDSLYKKIWNKLASCCCKGCVLEEQYNQIV